MVFVVIPQLNPHLENLVEAIRRNRVVNTDSMWGNYLRSLQLDNAYSEHTEQLGGLVDIKEHEVEFVNGSLNEAAFCLQIGLDFSAEIIPMESEWFLEKAKSLGLVNSDIYFARASNYKREWNFTLHHNADLEEVEIYKSKWQAALLNAIEIATDSSDICKAHLELVGIFSPSTGTLFRELFADTFINNLENYIDDFPASPYIEKAYEMLVWWLYTAKRYDALGDICYDFLENYPDAGMRSYISFHLGNAHYHIGEWEKARAFFSSVDRDALPESVYPGWGRQYIFDDLSRKIEEIESQN